MFTWRTGPLVRTEPYCSTTYLPEPRTWICLILPWNHSWYHVKSRSENTVILHSGPLKKWPKSLVLDDNHPQFPYGKYSMTIDGRRLIVVSWHCVTLPGGVAALLNNVRRQQVPASYLSWLVSDDRALHEFRCRPAGPEAGVRPPHSPYIKRWTPKEHSRTYVTDRDLPAPFISFPLFLVGFCWAVDL